MEAEPGDSVLLREGRKCVPLLPQKYLLKEGRITSKRMT